MDAMNPDQIEIAAQDEARKRYLIEKTFLPIVMVDAAGQWVRPSPGGNLESGRPVYRSMEGRSPRFLGYDWEPLWSECPIEDLGRGFFAVAY